MSWINDASRAAAGGVLALAWHPSRGAAALATDAALTLAFAALLGGHYRLTRPGFRADAEAARACQPASVVLLFCALAHACGVVTSLLGNAPLPGRVAALAALTAAAAAWPLPRTVRALLAPPATRPALSHLASARDLTALKAQAADRALFDRLKARVGALEAEYHRARWIAESHHSLGQLTHILTEPESRFGPGTGPAGSAPPGAGRPGPGHLGDIDT